MLEERLQPFSKYFNVRNAGDLLRLKPRVVPKTSSQHMALITFHRLKALRDIIGAQVNDEMLGGWVPALVSKGGGEEVTDEVHQNSNKSYLDALVGSQGITQKPKIELAEGVIADPGATQLA